MTKVKQQLEQDKQHERMTTNRKRSSNKTVKVWNNCGKVTERKLMSSLDVEKCQLTVNDGDGLPAPTHCNNIVQWNAMQWNVLHTLQYIASHNTTHIHIHIQSVLTNSFQVDSSRLPPSVSTSTYSYNEQAATFSVEKGISRGTHIAGEGE